MKFTYCALILGLFIFPTACEKTDNDATTDPPAATPDPVTPPVLLDRIKLSFSTTPDTTTNQYLYDNRFRTIGYRQLVRNQPNGFELNWQYPGNEAILQYSSLTRSPGFSSLNQLRDTISFFPDGTPERARLYTTFLDTTNTTITRRQSIRIITYQWKPTGEFQEKNEWVVDSTISVLPANGSIEVRRDTIRHWVEVANNRVTRLMRLSRTETSSNTSSSRTYNTIETEETYGYSQNYPAPPGLKNIAFLFTRTTAYPHRYMELLSEKKNYDGFPDRVDVVTRRRDETGRLILTTNRTFSYTVGYNAQGYISGIVPASGNPNGFVLEYR